MKSLYRWTGLIALFIFAVSLLPGAPLANGTAQAQTQNGQICFPETGECIAGAIRAYWEANGGLPVFGYPITPLRIETIDGWTGAAQWFQRDRLEDHGTAGVLAGRLGVEVLELRGQPWYTYERVSAAQVPPSCLFFPETGHSLCDPFLAYWRENGGLERFGYPITEPFTETMGDWTGIVQYFERRRMELHVGTPGLPILLGLLGTEILTFDPSLPVPEPDTPGTPGTPGDAGPIPECIEATLPRTTPETRLLRDTYEALPFRVHLGCPLAYLTDIDSALQRFERGEMLWINLEGYVAGGIPPTMARRFIYAIFEPGPTYLRYPDTWVAGVDPMQYDLRPPGNGLYAPWGGFGKLWVNDSNVRNALGWAVEPRAREGEASVIIFDNIYNDPENLGAMVLFHETSSVYAFGRLDMPEEVQVFR